MSFLLLECRSEDEVGGLIPIYFLVSITVHDPVGSEYEFEKRMNERSKNDNTFLSF